MFDLCQCTQREREREARVSPRSSNFRGEEKKLGNFRALEGGLNGRWRVDARER